MSNIAGKAYAMNVVTPIRFWTAALNKVIFWAAGKRPSTLSLIHYARWVVVDRDQFPHLSPQQPKEKLRFGYLFFSATSTAAGSRMWTPLPSPFLAGLTPPVRMLVDQLRFQAAQQVVGVILLKRGDPFL